MQPKMRAVTVERYGGIEAMQMNNTLPRPTEPGPTEVIVRVYAAAINPVDVSRREGKLKALLHDSFPFIPGKQRAHKFLQATCTIFCVQLLAEKLLSY
jgi:NADPH:quinone reductase-like Zn-dependent oxidoreductase